MQCTYVGVFYVWIYICNICIGVCYGVASVNRLDKILGLFCKRALLKRRYSAKETYNLIDPTNRSHPILRIERISWDSSLSFHVCIYICNMYMQYICTIHLYVHYIYTSEFYVLIHICIYVLIYICNIRVGVFYYESKESVEIRDYLPYLPVCINDLTRVCGMSRVCVVWPVRVPMAALVHINAQVIIQRCLSNTHIFA